MKKIFIFILPLFLISYLWSFNPPTGTKSIEIDWGDGTPKMVIDDSEPYIEDTIKGDGWEQKIYYKSSWVSGNELLYYLNENKNPQHDYKTGGHYTRTITFKDSSGNVLQTETDNITIPDADPIKASVRGIKPPNLKQPIITNTRKDTGDTLRAENDFCYIPGSNIRHQFTAVWDMNGISDPENYQLKRIEWYFDSPLSSTPQKKVGLQVEYNDFIIPSSSPYPSLITGDHFINKVTIKYVFLYKGSTPDYTSTTTSGIQSKVYPLLYTEKTFLIPVSDLLPSSDDASKLATELPNFLNVGFPADWIPTTGSPFPDSIIIRVVDNNPNLKPNDLSCSFLLVPQDSLPDPSKTLAEKAAIIMNFETPDAFDYNPKGAPTSIDDFNSVAMWEIDHTTSWKDSSGNTKTGFPVNMKGTLTIFCQPIGFGPGSPICPANKTFTVVDDDKPNIYVTLYDVFAHKRVHEVFANEYIKKGSNTLKEKKDSGTITLNEKNIAEIPPKKDPTQEIYEYQLTDNEDWEAQIPEKTFFEKTRIYLEIIVTDNINIVESQRISPPSHIDKVKITIEDYEGKTVEEKEITNLTQSKLEEKISFLSPFPTPTGKFYTIKVEATDKAPLYTDGTAKYPRTPNTRTFTIKVPITDRREVRKTLEANK